ncbi:DNA methyltransferase [Nonomuraea rubra]
MGYHGAKGRRGGWVGDAGGGASRFFPVFRYEAKAPSSERPKLNDGTAHATVKPLSLMRFLVRLVTRPGGVVLDPFAGSGTTGEACVLEGFQSVLIELDLKHAELIKARLSKPLQPTLDLFSGVSDAP